MGGIDAQASRPQSLSPKMGAVFRLYGQGLGYRMVAARLADLGVLTTRGNVERLIKGRPAYSGRRPSR
jgi:hypothetical protein